MQETYDKTDEDKTDEDATDAAASGGKSIKIGFPENLILSRSSLRGLRKIFGDPLPPPTTADDIFGTPLSE